MKKLLLILVVFVSLVVNPQSFLSQQCGIECGKERWKVKNLTDKTVKNVDFTPVSKSITWLRTRKRPNELPNTTRLIGIETMTFKVRGIVLLHKLEGNDEDFHVVIAEPNDKSKTMIIEFPDARCEQVCSSKFKEQIQQAREDFIDKIGQPKRGKFTEITKRILVEVIGVGFFDRMHGQRGRAMPSGVELHPVISFRVIEE